MAASRCYLGKGEECSTPTCRGRATKRRSLSAPFPVPGFRRDALGTRLAFLDTPPRVSASPSGPAPLRHVRSGSRLIRAEEGRERNFCACAEGNQFVVSALESLRLCVCTSTFLSRTRSSLFAHPWVFRFIPRDIGKQCEGTRLLPDLS